MAIVEIKDPREVAMKIENDREKQFRSVFYGIEDQFIALNTGEEGLGMTLRSLAWVTGQKQCLEKGVRFIGQQLQDPLGTC